MSEINPNDRWSSTSFYLRNILKIDQVVARRKKHSETSACPMVWGSHSWPFMLRPALLVDYFSRWALSTAPAGQLVESKKTAGGLEAMPVKCFERGKQNARSEVTWHRKTDLVL